MIKRISVKPCAAAKCWIGYYAGSWLPLPFTLEASALEVVRSLRAKGWDARTESAVAVYPGH